MTAVAATLLVALVNAVVYLWVSRLPLFGLARTPPPWIGAVAAGALIAATLVYGYSRLDHPPFETGPRVAMLRTKMSGRP